MFTIAQIKEVHSKVKSGADFPAYIQDIKKLGVSFYETFVADGHTDYYGAKDYKTSSPASYQVMIVSETSDVDQFKARLKAHQLGETNYPTFCRDCATAGVEKWVVDTEKMSCTYYDKSGKPILVEAIPQ